MGRRGAQARPFCERAQITHRAYSLPLQRALTDFGAEKSFGAAMADDLRAVATNVRGEVVAGSGHWLMEEQPTATMAVIVRFLNEGDQP